MSSAPLIKSYRRPAATAPTRPDLRQMRADPAGARPSSRLWLALYLPRLPLEALCRAGSGGDPVAVAGDDSARARVIAADDKIWRAGGRPGMLLTAACALLPAIRALHRDEAEEAAALGGLAAWSGQFTAFVSIERQGLLLEIGGSLKLFGGLDALCARIGEGIRALGYDGRMGVAPTPLAAWLLARAGLDTPVVSPSLLPGHLAPVPLDCLDLPETAREDLRRMGIRSFGDCCRLPRDGLARRISPKLIELLDKALGRRPDPRRPYTPPPVFERCIHLPFELRRREALLVAARLLLAELHGYLSARAGGVQSLEVHLGHRRVPATRMTLSLASPGRDPAQLLMLLEARLARVSLKEPVRYLGLRATDILPLAPDNGDLYAPLTGTGRDWKTLLAQLEARLSVENVHALGVRADYRPECGWRMTRGTDPFSSASAGNPGKQRADKGADPFSRSLPLWLLPRPQPLETAAGAPCRRGRLTLQKGPQRIESGWWDAAPVARDYYVAADPGGARLWIFRDLSAPQRWYLHGVFG